MNRKTAKDLLPIIKAFSEGKCVEIKTSSGWISIENMGFVGNPLQYRIKPEPKYRPFANEEECLAEMQKHQLFGWLKIQDLYRNIANIMSCSITFADNEACDVEYEKAFKNYTFADGMPFGIKVEE